MQADLRVAEPLAEISLSGDLDAAAVETVARLVTTAVRTSAVTGMAIDVSGVTFCDSMGLSILIAAHNACSDAGLDFTLRNPTWRLRRLLVITGLTEALRVQPDARDDDD